MSLGDLREKLVEVVGEPAILACDYQKCGRLLEVTAEVDQVQAIAAAALETDFYLESITAVDFTNGFQAIYHFNSFGPASRVQVRVQLGKGASLPSISNLYNGALWHEREVFDLFGIHFDEHPDLRRILLPDDADFHPLLKDFGKVHAFRSTEEIYDDTDA